MSGERDANPSGTVGADLLSSLPADEPGGGLRELHASLEALREEVAGLREAVQAPRAVTPEALEAWGEQFVERAAEAARPEGALGKFRAMASHDLHSASLVLICIQN